MKIFARLIFVLLVHVLVGCESDQSRWPTRKFERSTWLHTSEEKRFIFAKDLVESKKLLGLSKSEVIALLGAPSYDSAQGDLVTYLVKSDSEGVFVLGLRLELKNGESRVVRAFVRIA